ncbi:MAG TPA: hypothetical protein VI912_02210 [Candidatus Bilamarchaeaceae archaeon]|nr:hypothetical protein [Candidatus Bilamarchaeaceae archaeon]
MGKGWLKVLVFIVSLAIGYGLTVYWQQLRPADDPNTVITVGVVGFVASFISLYFMTKGGGGE